MLLWQGSCLVHDEFKGIELDLLRAEYPDAKVLVHPESPARRGGAGRRGRLDHAADRRRAAAGATHFIVATDNGILHKMRLAAPGKTFIEAPTAGNSATCKSCAHCPWMAMNGLRNLADVLERGHNEIHVDPAIGEQARAPSTACSISPRAKKRVQAERRLAHEAQLFRTGSGMTGRMSERCRVRRA